MKQPSALGFCAATIFLAGLAESVPAREIAIKMGAKPGLQFSVVRFEASPGDTVKVTFANNDEMTHNMLITAPRQRHRVLRLSMQLGPKGPEMHYVPKNRRVLAATKLLKPGESETLTWKVPAKRDVYPYLCTFPGHGFIMYGAIYVGVPMPAFKDDPNIPDAAKLAAVAGKSFHAWGHKRPTLYRTFMPDAGPAAFAVAMNNTESYCWDAGPCRLRYAWTGGFIDPWPVWRGNGNGLAAIKGRVYYRASKTFPLRVGGGGGEPKVRFRGYRKVGGLPEFHYEVDGADVRELITPLRAGTGCERTFKVDTGGRPLVFRSDHAETMTFTSSAGRFADGLLRLSAEQAAEFTITMTPKNGRGER